MQKLDVRSRIKRPVPDKAILWPTARGYGDHPQQNTDSTKFPQLAAIKARKNSTPPEPLYEFVKAMGEAQDRIFVLDEYLFKEKENSLQIRLNQVLQWFPDSLQARDVRLLTASVNDSYTESDIKKQLERRATNINRVQAYPSGLQIEVRFTLTKYFPYIHDRFAIIDDELWHFGATVGGFHELVNAATRGWSVHDHGALTFFDTAWNGDSDMVRSFDKSRLQK